MARNQSSATLRTIKGGIEMKFQKANVEMVSFFDAIAPAAGAGIEKRKLCGYPCRFVNGNLFMGLHNNNMILRLPQSDRADFVKLGVIPFEPMPARIMKEYVLVPKEMIRSRGLKAWIGRSLSYSSAVPL